MKTQCNLEKNDNNLEACKIKNNRKRKMIKKIKTTVRKNDKIINKKTTFSEKEIIQIKTIVTQQK